MKCKEIQEQKEINLQLENKKKVQNLKEKGITLIALVVTIIILLILAGVTLNIAMSGDGLFSRARNAADKYKKAQEDEQKLISEIGKEMNSEYVGTYITGYEPTEGTCTITGDQSGTGTDQTFTTEEEGTLKWRIWDYDGTVLRIILDKPTVKTLNLTKVNGYNNGVWAMNEVCRKCFGKYEGNDCNGTMKKGISVANLRRSDVEKVSNYDYTKYKHGEDSDSEVIGEEGNKYTYYGERIKCSLNYQSPAKWEKHDMKWNYNYDKEKRIGVGDPSCEYPWEQEFKDETNSENGKTSGETEFIQSTYNHEYLNKEKEFYNGVYYDMLFKDELGDFFNCGYWLSSRSSYVINGVCGFGFNAIRAFGDYGKFGNYGVYYSNRDI